ncbi:hypothetical protein PybrP1_006607 [[Pythium] brassicae (nom. inval.)]|nr:hypothetical protein PybrP1_006607 [[Pythium] brassicae (nom. inval.)]
MCYWLLQAERHPGDTRSRPRPRLSVPATPKAQDINWKVMNFATECTTEKLRHGTTALITAMWVYFPKANRVCCYFHWKQARSRTMCAPAIAA